LGGNKKISKAIDLAQKWLHIDLTIIEKIGRKEGLFFE